VPVAGKSQDAAKPQSTGDCARGSGNRTGSNPPNATVVPQFAEFVARLELHPQQTPLHFQTHGILDGQPRRRNDPATWARQYAPPSDSPTKLDLDPLTIHTGLFDPAVGSGGTLNGRRFVIRSGQMGNSAVRLMSHQVQNRNDREFSFRGVNFGLRSRGRLVTVAVHSHNGVADGLSVRTTEALGRSKKTADWAKSPPKQRPAPQIASAAAAHKGAGKRTPGGRVEAKLQRSLERVLWSSSISLTDNFFENSGAIRL